MNNGKDDSAGTIVTIIIVVLFGWWFFSSIGNQSGDTESGSENYSEYQDDSSNSRESDPEGYYESQGYECTDDCSGHDAGYEWADDNGVCDEYYSDGNSESFDEGVQSYSEENC